MQYRSFEDNKVGDMYLTNNKPFNAKKHTWTNNYIGCYVLYSTVLTYDIRMYATVDESLFHKKKY